MDLKTVLIVDPELGFVFWLGQALDEAHYEALPAKSVPDAIALIASLKLSIDLLIVNPRLEGMEGLVEGLRRSRDRLKVIALLDHPGDGAGSLRDADALHCKSLRADAISKLGWLDAVRSVLSYGALTH